MNHGPLHARQRNSCWQRVSSGWSIRLPPQWAGPRTTGQARRLQTNTTPSGRHILGCLGNILCRPDLLVSSTPSTTAHAPPPHKGHSISLIDPFQCPLGCGEQTRNTHAWVLGRKGTQRTHVVLRSSNACWHEARSMAVAACVTATILRCCKKETMVSAAYCWQLCTWIIRRRHAALRGHTNKLWSLKIASELYSRV